MRTVAIRQDCVYVCEWFARQNVYNMSLVGTKDKCQTFPSTPLTPTNILQGTLTIGVGGIDKNSTSVFLKKYCGITTYLLLE